MSGVKIQLNSLEALERLIGNDTEAELEIRNSIVQNFSKKYLKGVINETAVEKINKAVREEISGSSFVYTLSDRAKKLIDEYIEKAVEKKAQEEFEKKVRAFLAEEIDKYFLEAEDFLEEKLKQYLQNKFEDEMFADMGQKMVDRFKERIAEIWDV